MCHLSLNMYMILPKDTTYSDGLLSDQHKAIIENDVLGRLGRSPTYLFKFQHIFYLE